MPSKWVEPDVAYIHETDDGDVVVYHTYKSDEYNNVHTHWFRMDLGEQDEMFDIRDWPGYEPKQSPEENLAAACKAGDIVPLWDGDPEGFCGLQPRHRCTVIVTLEVTYVAPEGETVGSKDDVGYLLDASIRGVINRHLLTDGQGHLTVGAYQLSVDPQ